MIGPYILKRPLGKGGVAQVYLAVKRNASHRRTVCVIKFPLPQYATSSKHAQRFVKEAELLLELGSHDNVVYVFDVGRHRGMPYVVMEYVDGLDLAEVLKALQRKHTRLSEEAVHCVLAGMAAGLHHAHARATIDDVPVRIVHRDVTPSNVIISRDGAVKLVDFGLGVATQQGTSGHHWRGTLAYMSPEHLYCQVCPEMDIYSLGVVGWEMLANRPFRSLAIKAPQQLLTAIFAEPIPALTKSEADPLLAELIMSCLDRNPKMRPRADEFGALLAKCPGHTRDPRVLEQEISPVVSKNRSSGHSQEECAATADLIATMAVVEHDHHAATTAEPFDPLVPPDADAPRFLHRQKKGSGTDGTLPGLYRAAAVDERQCADDSSAALPSKQPGGISQQTTTKWRRDSSHRITIPACPRTDDGTSSVDITLCE
jgi:serine/threonine protein kinase